MTENDSTLAPEVVAYNLQTGQPCDLCSEDGFEECECEMESEFHV
jgi:hypothetical protein